MGRILQLGSAPLRTACLLVSGSLLTGGCGGDQQLLAAQPAPTSSASVELATTRCAPPFKSREDALDQIGTAYDGGNDSRVLRLLVCLAEGPLGTAADLAAIGDLHAQKGAYEAAELWYRKANAADTNDWDITLSLVELFLERRMFNDAIQIAKSFHAKDDEIRSAQHLVIGRAYASQDQRSDACREAVTAVFLDPRSQEAWDFHARCSLQESNAALNRASVVEPELFAEVLSAGPAGQWAEEDRLDRAELYHDYAVALEAAARPSVAKRYRLMVGLVLVDSGVRLARRKEPGASLQMFTRAETVAGVGELPLNFHLAALRDMVIGYTRVGEYVTAMAVAERLFELCHAGEVQCPVFAVAYPMFAGSVEVSGMDPVIPVHLQHLSLVLRDACANVSFQLDSGALRYADGHDFVGSDVHNAIVRSSEDRAWLARKYATVSPEEDRIALAMFARGHPEEARQAIRTELEARRYELPVRLLLSELNSAATMGAPVIPRPVTTGEILGVPISDIELAMSRATRGQVPEPTLVAFRVAKMAIALMANFGTWFDEGRGATLVKIPPEKIDPDDD